MAFKHLDEIGDDLLAQAMSDKPLLHFGLTAFDNLLDGMHSNRVNIISGDPGCGKSTFVGALADDAAENGAFVLLHSFELASSCYFAKSIARSSENKLTIKDISDQGKAELVKATSRKYLDRVSHNFAFVEEDKSIDHLHKLVIKQHEQNPEQPILVIVDYIQIAKKDAFAESNDERMQIKEVLNTLRQIAKIGNTAVFAVSAVARGNYNKKEPSLSSMSGSSCLEYGADTCSHLSTTANDDELMKPVTLTFLKNRFGAKGETSLIFDVEHASFVEA